MSKEIITKEEVLENEDSLLQNLIEAVGFKDDEALRRKIEIRRKGKLLFAFTVRPLDEDEEFQCQRKATKKIPNPRGKRLPKIDGPVDPARFRRWKIYTATIAADRKKIWDNAALWEKIQNDSGMQKRFGGIVEHVELIDRLLMSDEKTAVCNIIDELGEENSEVSTEGFSTAETPDVENASLEEYAKN